jgi:GAF domain-containing protein
LGTLWAIAHSGPRFDREDKRLLMNIARFCAASYRLSLDLRSERAQREEADRKLRERSRQLWQARIALGL